ATGAARRRQLVDQLEVAAARAARAARRVVPGARGDRDGDDARGELVRQVVADGYRRVGRLLGGERGRLVRVEGDAAGARARERQRRHRVARPEAQEDVADLRELDVDVRVAGEDAGQGGVQAVRAGAVVDLRALAGGGQRGDAVRDVGERDRTALHR